MTAGAIAEPISLPERRQARARARSGPAHIRIEKRALVESCMDAQALALEVVTANAAAIQNLLRLPAGPERDEAVRATHRVHERAVEGLKVWRAAADRYERTTPTD